MISPESRSIEWIKECASRLGVHDKLNKLKKTLGEAFFYWLEIQKIEQDRH